MCSSARWWSFQITICCCLPRRKGHDYRSFCPELSSGYAFTAFVLCCCCMLVNSSQHPVCCLHLQLADRSGYVTGKVLCLHHAGCKAITETGCECATSIFHAPHAAAHQPTRPQALPFGKAHDWAFPKGWAFSCQLVFNVTASHVLSVLAEVVNTHASDLQYGPTELTAKNHVCAG